MSLAPKAPQLARANKKKAPVGTPSKGLIKDDYLYALEVAGQPAKTAAEKAIKRQAKIDMKYLESKFPKYTASIKNPSTRYQRPEFGGPGPVVARGKKPSGSTRIGSMGNSRFSRKPE